MIRVEWRRGVLVALVAVLIVAVVPPVAIAAPTGCALGAGETESTVAASRVPVLFVHGIQSGRDMWDAPVTGRTAAVTTLVGQIDGATAYTFSYRDAALDWVADQRIGPTLAATINCLATASGRKVVVVAHSMGGLATQLALREPIDSQHQCLGDSTPDACTAANVLDVVTLGTPFQGSLMLSYGQAARVAADALAVLSGRIDLAIAMEEMLATCAKAAQASLQSGGALVCGRAGVLDSPAGRALLYHSREIAELPAWPTSVPLRAEAGDIYLPERDLISTPWLTVSARPVLIGDWAVTADSAEAVSQPSEPVHCAVDRRDAVAVFANAVASDFATPACAHNALAANPDLVGVILATVRAAVKAQTPTPVDEIDWSTRRYTVDCAGIGDRPFGVDVRNGVGAGPPDSQNSDGLDVRVVDAVPGELTGDGTRQEAVLLSCAPRNVSPNFYTVEVQVFRAGPGKLATLRPPVGATPSDFGIEPRLNGQPFAVADGHLLTGTDYWVGRDARCCPSVTKTIQWTWNGSGFTAS